MTTIHGETDQPAVWFNGPGKVLGDKVCTMQLHEHICIVYNRQKQPVQVDLTPSEWRILEALKYQPGGLVTYRQLARACWGNIPDEPTRTKPMAHWHIANIRKRIRAISGKEPIKTVKGFGYKWVVNDVG